MERPAVTPSTSIDFSCAPTVSVGQVLIRRLLVTALVIVGLGTGLCACGTPPTEDAGVTVQQDGRQTARLTLLQLQRLPQVDVATPQSRGAKTQRGPTVRVILDAAGAAQIASVRVEGRGAPQTLTAADLTDTVILCLTKRHTLKLTGTDLGIERWVRDVTTLVVNP